MGRKVTANRQFSGRMVTSDLLARYKVSLLVTSRIQSRVQFVKEWSNQEHSSINTFKWSTIHQQSLREFLSSAIAVKKNETKPQLRVYVVSYSWLIIAFMAKLVLIKS